MVEYVKVIKFYLLRSEPKIMIFCLTCELNEDLKQHIPIGFFVSKFLYLPDMSMNRESL